MNEPRLEDSEDLYCVCQKTYEEGEFMIECGKCNEWFHGSCIGIEEYQAQDIDVYHCPKCQPMYGPLVYSFLDVTYENGIVKPVDVKRRRNISRHNYKEIHEGTKQISAGSVMFVRQLKARKFADAHEITTVLQDGRNLSADSLQKDGFKKPILIYDKTDLGLVVPPSNFTIYDVEKRVGSLFELHVIDVAKQEDLRMKMREWTEYYNSPVRGKVLNVISLEFSKTSLDDLVIGPELVRNISWVENVWPKNPPEDSLHTKPVVSKYCLMSVKDCYTDFHVDFGGTSVWYHVVRGEKIFYLIEPTVENLKKFEQWVSSSDQGQVFFGQKVNKCYKLNVKQGNTLLIPTGWIHAVLTPSDSLVFGGNFLHSFNIPLQQRIYTLEKTLNTPLKFLFPNFETTNWYAARSILKKIKDLHGAGVRMPHFLHEGVRDLIIALKSWVLKKGDLVKHHKLQVPIEISPLKLIKSLEKVLKIDSKMDSSLDFVIGQLSSPALLSVKSSKTILKFKLPRQSESETSGTSSPERSLSTDRRLERKKEKLQRKEQRLKEELLAQGGGVPSIKLNIKNKDMNSARICEIKEDSDDETLKEDGRGINQDRNATSALNNKIITEPTIKLKLSLPQKESTSSNSSSPDIITPFSVPFAITSESLFSQNDHLIGGNSRLHPLVHAPATPADIKAEIEAAKKDLFFPENSKKSAGLYFTPQSQADDFTVKPVTFNPMKTFPKKSKLEEPELKINESNDGGGYVIDFLPKPKAKLVKKRRLSEDSDYDPSDDTYYQDAEYVYPRIDVTSEITTDDFSWNPGQRKKPKINKMKRSRLNGKHSEKDDSDDFFAPDDEIRELKKMSSLKQLDSTASQTSVKSATSMTVSKPISKERKKGFTTAKQRLGKLLKLDKTGSRYVR